MIAWEVQINVKEIRMKNFDQKEVNSLNKKEWSEPQMTQLDVKQTKAGAIPFSIETQSVQGDMHNSEGGVYTQ